jgi:drug/metabolite transporter (DMT)-like permease
MSTKRTHLTYVGIALFVTVLWSSSWVLIRWGLDRESLRPLTFAALRYGLASIVMVGSVLSNRTYRRQVFTMSRAVVVRIVLLGIVFYTLTQGAIFVALDNQPAATTSLLLAMTPLAVAMLANRSLRETTEDRQVTGAVLVAVGAFLYFVGGLGATLIGIVAALVALASNVTGSLLGRQVNRSRDTSPVVVTAISMTVGSVALAIIGGISEGVPSVSIGAWGIIAWLAVVNTAFAFTLWNLSLRRLTALESAGINNTMLVQIALLAWVFLGESPGVLGLVGIALVSIGVLLTQAPRSNGV